MSRGLGDVYKRQVYVDGIYLRRNWGGEFENVAILVAIAVNEDGYREVLGAAEGMKEDKASWINFFQWLRGRGLDGVKLIVGDKCLGMLEAVGEVFPEAKYQRCTVHFYRNVFSVTPRSKVKLVAKMLKAIHAQESKKAAREKARAVVEELCSMKLKEAAKKVEDSIEETLTYCDFPSEHWTRIRTNNVIERLNQEIRRREWQQIGQQLHKYENLLNREFHAERPNSKWVTDISYIHTKQGVLYLSIIRDLHDSSIVASKTGTCVLYTSPSPRDTR